ncbi:MAG TPA: hypothetical protein VN833_04760 [Candidatus Acidoferrales bacterium]|jgi:hypothetical protein|nr:hypothetical protein [Candidatus Acidoferrales bacterium]
MFLAGRETDEAAGTDLLDRAFPALRPAATSSDDENLTKRMRMPSGAVRGSKVTLAPHQRRVRRLKKRIDPHGAGEPI